MVGHGLDPTTVTPPPSPHSRQNNSVIDTAETSRFTASLYYIRRTSILCLNTMYHFMRRLCHRHYTGLPTP